MRNQRVVLMVLSLLIVGILFYGILNSQKEYNQNELDRIEQNIRKAVITCYSIEGFYPSDLEYLEENYGLVIDQKEINVFYQAVGSNIFPDIMVTRK